MQKDLYTLFVEIVPSAKGNMLSANTTMLSAKGNMPSAKALVLLKEAYILLVMAIIFIAANTLKTNTANILIAKGFGEM